MTTAAAIEIQGLTKRFGRHAALAGVDLHVSPGSVFGFLGPNGAGKTTTLRILTGLAKPTDGRASILGHEVLAAGNEVRAAIGYLPDVPGFYDWMTGEEFLRFVGRLFSLGRGVLAERVAALLDLAGLTGVTTRIGGYSRGMRQRLGIAQALINAPRLLLLDEPTSALDPLGRREVLEMIRGLAGRATVFFSTHILADVERVCDSVAILNLGKVVAQGTLAELTATRGAAHVLVEIEGDPTRLAARLAHEPWVRMLRRDGGVIDVAVTDLPAAQRSVPKLIASEGWALRRFDVAERTLEDVFADLIGGREAP